MKKSTVFIYSILFLVLIFFTIKINPTEKKYNGINTININTNINYKESKIKQYIPNKNKNKNPEQKFSKKPKIIEHELLAKIKTKADDTSKKNIYKILKDNKYGLLNENEEIITKIIYDNFLNFDEEKGIFISILNNKKGLMNYKGKILVPAEFETIKKTDYPNLVLTKKHKYYGLYDIKLAKEIIKSLYAEIRPIDKKNWIISSHNKLGLVHYYNGITTIIKPKYTSITIGQNNLITNNQNKLGLIDQNSGKIISEPKYDEITLLNNNTYNTDKILIYKTRIGNRYGLIYYNSKESTIIAPIYDDINYKNQVNVLSHGYWRILDNKGNVILRNSYAIK